MEEKIPWMGKKSSISAISLRSVVKGMSWTGESCLRTRSFELEVVLHTRFETESS